MGISVVEAWMEVAPERREPSAITVLKGQRSTMRTVYRLEGAGPRGADVVAKRCLKPTARVERLVYERVLPRLPVSAPRYYGSVEEEDAFDWLFLEDVGSERFSPLVPEHRALAARWLGALHAGAEPLGLAASLPDRRPCSYRERLRAAGSAIAEGLHAPGLRPEDRRVLESVARRCQAIAGLWAGVENRCERMPQTLVHGDFRPKNARVRSAAQGAVLYPLDWEMAGWGVPAVDLAPSRFGVAGCAVDLDVYWSVAGEAWPELDVAAVQEMEGVGRLFRVLDAVGWASATLESSPEKSLVWLRPCEPALAEAMRGLA